VTSNQVPLCSHLNIQAFMSPPRPLDEKRFGHFPGSFFVSRTFAVAISPTGDGKLDWVMSSTHREMKGVPGRNHTKDDAQTVQGNLRGASDVEYLNKIAPERARLSSGGEESQLNAIYR
jgi:hypothetical protein